MKKSLLAMIVLVLSGLVYGQAFYVGPETCMSCHNPNGPGTDKTNWRSTLHANGYSEVLDDRNSMVVEKGVIADYDQNGVDDFKDGLNFNNISSAFDIYKPNAPILGYSPSTGYTVTIGQVTHRVYLTYGGSGLWKQRYAVRINTSEGESKDLYISPVQYNEKTHEYVIYHGDAWYDANNNPKFTPSSTLADAATNSRSLAKGCSGCHVTGLTLSKTANNEWVAKGAGVLNASQYTGNPSYFDLDGDGNLDQINTGCEKCHGAGSDHVLGGGDPSKIINPETDLTVEQANNLCGMCHSRGKSKPNNTFSFAYDDQNMVSWNPGDLVDDFYTDGGGYWPDGDNSKKHHQQFRDLYKSGKPTFQFHNVACYECHDPHGSTNEHQVVTEIEEEDSLGNPITIPTEPDNNTLCLACHATHGDFAAISKEMVADYSNNINTIAAIVSEHSNHSYDPEGATAASRCTKCHMPKVAKSAINYDIHSHTFEAISPAKTLTYNMPNTCAVSCHGTKNPVYPTLGIDMTADNFSNWSEQTDVDLSNKLLFWYDNMFFEHLGGQGAQVNAVETMAPPVVDGDTTDAAWGNQNWTEIPITHDKKAWMKATYTATDLYVLLKWQDPTLSMTRSGSWNYDNGNWINNPGQSEDRVALYWNISIPADEFAERGCMTKCHRDIDNNKNGISEDDAYLPAGQTADMWHMKAARFLGAISANANTSITVDPATHQVTAGSVTLNGYMDDKYVGAFSEANAPDGGRYGDAGSGAETRNRNSAKTAPLYIEKNPVDYIDAMILTQDEINNGEVDEVATADPATLAADWAKYVSLNAVVPERILKTPDGSRSDIRESATWVDGYWYAEITRKLNTGNSDDAQFSTNSSYQFGIALMDNSGGDEHWTTGSVLSTLNLGVTSVSEKKENNMPNSFSLTQNYPNPFNPSTEITYTVPAGSNVKIIVFNSIGEQVEVLVDGFKNPGTYKLNWDASRYASGIYFYRMQANNFSEVKKMVLLK